MIIINTWKTQAVIVGLIEMELNHTSYLLVFCEFEQGGLLYTIQHNRTSKSFFEREYVKWTVILMVKNN